MPRQARTVVAGGTYHVTARGNRRQAIFSDDYDRRLFLRILEDSVVRFRWRCASYCLLSNHFHVLVETPRDPGDLTAGMHRLNGRYAQWFNDRHEQVGHLFQGRFGSELIESEGHLLRTVRYIARNPIEAGLCVAPDDWPWSSYASMIGRAPRPGFLSQEVTLDLFGNDRPRARALFADFVNDAS